MHTIKQVGIVWSLSAGLILAVVVACRGQDQKPDPSDSIEKWIEVLKLPDDHTALRKEAREALGPDGPYAKVAVAALIDADAHKKAPVGWEPIATLADYGPAVVPTLVLALKRPETRVRAAVAEALGMVHPKPIDAVPALIEAIKDSSPDVRAATASSLGNIRRPLEKTIPALVTALRDDQGDVRVAAAAALYAMGRIAKPALPSLIVALKDRDEAVRMWAGDALGKFGPGAKAAVPALIDTLRDKNKHVRNAAGDALGKIGPAATAAVPALIEALRDKKSGSYPGTMAQAIGEIGPEAKAAVPALIEAVQEKDDDLRQYAAVALGKIGPGAKAAVPVLIAAAKDKNNQVRDKAITALGKIGPDAKAAVPLLIEALAKRESYLSFRGMVAEALGGIGTAAKEAVPALATLARNQLDGDGIADTGARQTAAEAVMKIDPEFGAKNGIELSYLDVRLGKIPAVKLAPRAALTEEKKKHIQKLIADLAGSADPDFGLSSTLTGHAFAPVPGREHFGMGLVTDHRIKTSNPMRSLVEIGPDALPFLLNALRDRTPTKLKVELGLMNLFITELPCNPLNALERRALWETHPEKRDYDDDDDDQAREYTLKVGDVCFVAIGQIVGRRYSAARYQPTAMVIINSPVKRKELCERVRTIWSSKEPAQKLLDSLLIDYATEGIFNGKSLDGWGEGSNRQIEAALRLLYYFPKESAPLIAERLKRMDVNKPKSSDDGTKRDVANGVDTTEFLKAINWCREPLIRKRLLDIFERTNDVYVTLAVLPLVKEGRGELIVPRLQGMLKKLPESEDDAAQEGYELLLALSQYAGKGAKPEFESYLRDGSLQRRRTMCQVLKEVHSEWALEFLTPMLTDKRTGFARKTLRLCDIAAWTLSEIHSDLKFDSEGTPEELDRRIEEMRKQIARKQKE